MQSTTSTLFRAPLSRSIAIILSLLVISSWAISAQINFSPVIDIGRINVNDLVRTESGELLVGSPSGLFLRMSNVDPWVEIDFSHEVYSLERLADGTILAGTSRGIQRSTDDGRTWTISFNVANVGDFGVKEDGTVMAIDRGPNPARDGYVYSSTDNGTTWTTSKLNFATLFQTNVVGLGDLFFSGSASGLKLTYNNGEVWETTRLIDSVGSVIATDNGVLIAAAGNDRVSTFLWESQDTGRSWILVDSLHGIRALTAGEGGEYFVTVVGTYGHPGEVDKGLWRRTAGAEGRQLVYEGDGIVDLLADGEDLLLAANLRILAGKSTGNAWENVTGAIMEVRAGPIASTPDGAVYAMIPDSIRFFFSLPRIESTIFRSDDNGLTWTQLHRSLTPEWFGSDSLGNLYINERSHFWEKDGENAYSYFGQVYQTSMSHDRGESFTPLFNGSLRKVSAGPSGVLAAVFTDSLKQRPVRDLLFSIDSGASWQKLTDEGNPWQGRENLPIVGAVEVANDGAIIVSLTGDEESGIYRIVPEEGGLVITGSDQTVDPFDIVRMDDGRLLGTSRLIGGGMYRSSDNGISWQPISEGERMQNVTPLGGGTLWGDGRFFSKDFGNSWFSAEQLQAIVRGVDGVLYAIGGSGTTYRKSFSEGQLWIDANFQNVSMYGHDIEVNRNGHIFIATNDGLFYSVEAASIPAIQSARASDDGIRLEVRGSKVYVRGSRLESNGTIGRIYDLNGRLIAEFPLQPSGDDLLMGTLPATSPLYSPQLVVVSSGEDQGSVLIVR